MTQINYIRHLYENEEKSLRQIAEETKMDFRTVQKYAYQSDWNVDKLPNVEPESYPVLGPYIETINEWLEQDAREPRKQRHTRRRIYERLRNEKSYKGGYTSVKRYVNKKKFLMKQKQDGFLPLA